jgi:TetR/AcrR family transcriptional repressor of uid operon
MTAEPATGRTADPEAAPGQGLDPETRERLLDAADRLVRQIGMAKTSMADVARVAGVARGTLYRYFKSRESLFNAVMRRTTRSVLCGRRGGDGL